jgi:nucleotide-binding universal stress UspA family protein
MEDHMFKHILLPTDGSQLSELAIRRGIDLAKTMNARVTGFCVVPEFHVFTYRTEMLEETEGQYARESRARAAEDLAFIANAAKEAGVQCDTSYVINDRPYEAIVKAAEDKGCDLILMASHGRSGMSGFLLGSETQKVLTHTGIPVLVYRESKS